jgi:hypothetical protein
MRGHMKLRSILTMLFLTAVLVTGFVAGRAHAAQPHMNSAVRHLRSAHSELEAATADKGGHREKAMHIIDRAISETEEGISYAR